LFNIKEARHTRKVDQHNIGFATALDWKNMEYRNVYCFTIIVNCVTVIHYCVNKMGRTQDRGIFCAIAALTIVRLLMDIIFRQMPAMYIGILGFFVGAEFLMLDYTVRKMQKISTSPSIIMLFLSICMLTADISYCLHFMWIATSETTQPPSLEPEVPFWED